MSSPASPSQRYVSLPKKTQPTVSNRSHPRSSSISSFKERTPHSLAYMCDTCPQVSQWERIDSRTYLHKMQIDYGRLQKPEKYAKITLNQQNKNAEDIIQQGTKRMTGISKMAQEQSSTAKKSHKIQQIRVPLPLSSILQEEKSPQLKKPHPSYSTHLKKVVAKTQSTTARKRIHSRIIKTIVGGGKMQTMMICYPDNEQYLKMVRQGRK